MNITISFIEENFHKFNKEYFNGELRTPRFEITHVKSYLGQYHWQYDWHGYLRESVIRISDKFDRSETDVCNTIIHEMIHLYIRQNKIKDTRAHHGRVFNGIADRINRQGGWHIARTDSVAGCGLTDKKEVKLWTIAIFKDERGKYFSFAINRKYLNYYISKFNRYKYHYKDVFVFTSNDDKKYAHFTECRKSVRGWYITKKEYDEIRERETNFIHLDL